MRGDSEPCQSRYWTTKNNYRIRFCKRCSHAFVSDKISSKELEDYYSSHEKYGKVEGYESDLRRQNYPGSRSDAANYICLIERALGGYKHSVSFLEVGAGWAYASRIANEKGWEVDAIEYSLHCVSALRECLPDSSVVWQGSFESFANTSNKVYDCILMSQVLEHSIDPAQWLTIANSMLRIGGCLVVAVPQFKGIYGLLGSKDPYITPPEHLNFFTRHSLGLLANRSGFKLVSESGYSRIPFYNIKRRFKAHLLSIFAYRTVQFVQYCFDSLGISGIQVQVFTKVRQ